MKIFQRSCANRFVFVSECKIRAKFYSGKMFWRKILDFLEKYGFFGIFTEKVRGGDGKIRAIILKGGFDEM